MRYRSRHEVGFAEFLHRRGLRFEYEFRTFDLENGETYTPDFWCPEIGVIFEVKGGTHPERLHKPWILARLLNPGSLVGDWVSVQDPPLPRVYLAHEGTLYKATERGWRWRIIWLHCGYCNISYPVHDMEDMTCRSCLRRESRFLGYALRKVNPVIRSWTP